MINKEQVDSILQKSKEIEKEIEDNKKRSQELSNKLIELNTKKQQLILTVIVWWPREKKRR